MAVNANLAVLITAQDRASGPLRKTQRQISSLAKNVDKMNKSFKGFSGGQLAATVGITGLGAAAAGVGLKFNMMAETATLAFQTLLKDGAKGTAFFEDLKAFALKTPFELEGLTDAARRMLGFGFASQDVIPILKDVGDAVGAMGGGAEMIESVTRALGQMQTKGKLQAEEMMQLAEAGIPVWQILRDNIDEVVGAEGGAKFRSGMAAMVTRLQATGMSLADATKSADAAGVQKLMKMVSAGKITSAKGIAALRKGMAQQFGGLGEKQALTTAGALSNLNDKFKQFMGTLMGPVSNQAVGAIDMVSNALGGLQTIIQGLPSEMAPLKTMLGALAIVGGIGVGSGLAGMLGSVNPMVIGILALVAALAMIAPALGKIGSLVVDDKTIELRFKWGDKDSESFGAKLAKDPFVFNIQADIEAVKKGASDAWKWLTTSDTTVAITANITAAWKSTPAGWLWDRFKEASGTGDFTANLGVAWKSTPAGWLWDRFNEAGSSADFWTNLNAAWSQTPGGWLWDRITEAASAWPDFWLGLNTWWAQTPGGWLWDRIVEAAGSVPEFWLGLKTWWAQTPAGWLWDRIVGATSDWPDYWLGLKTWWAQGPAGWLWDQITGAAAEVPSFWVGLRTLWAQTPGGWLWDRISEAASAWPDFWIGLKAWWAQSLGGRIWDWLVAAGGDLAATLKLALDTSSWPDWAKRLLGVGGSGAPTPAPSSGFSPFPAPFGPSPRVVNVGDNPIPFMAEGGTIASAGLAYLHAGETVTPAGRGGGQIVFNNYGVLAAHDAEDWVVSMMSRAARRGRVG